MHTCASLTQAYEVLGNAEKKTLYDQYGKAGVDPNNTGGAGGDPFVSAPTSYCPLLHAHDFD